MSFLCVSFLLTSLLACPACASFPLYFNLANTSHSKWVHWCFFWKNKTKPFSNRIKLCENMTSPHFLQKTDKNSFHSSPHPSCLRLWNPQHLQFLQFYHWLDATTEPVFTVQLLARSFPDYWLQINACWRPNAWWRNSLESNHKVQFTSECLNILMTEVNKVQLSFFSPPNKSKHGNVQISMRVKVLSHLTHAPSLRWF